MKKRLITALFAGTVFLASAQIPKGSIFAGLNAGFNSYKTDYSNTNGPTKTNTENFKGSNWNLTPNVQYFFRENMSVGAGIAVSHNKSSYEYPQTKNSTEYTNNGMGFNLFARKYLNCGTNFHTFMELNLGTNSSKGEKNEFDGNTSKTTLTKSEYHNSNLAVNLGFAWLITQRVMMQGNFGFLGFSRYNNKYNIINDTYNSNKGSSFGFFMESGNYPFSMGFAYRLNK